MTLNSLPGTRRSIRFWKYRRTVDIEERFPLPVIHPVVRHPAQAEPVAGDIAAGQFSFFTVVDADMSVDVKRSGHVGVRLHPGFGQRVSPCGYRRRIRRYRAKPLPQAAHLRNTVKSEQFAELAGAPRRKESTVFTRSKAISASNMNTCVRR